MNYYPPMWKYHHKFLPMVVSNSPVIFHQKSNDLFLVFEFICAYIDAFWFLQNLLEISHRKMRTYILKLKEREVICNIENYLFGNP